MKTILYQIFSYFFVIFSCGIFLPSYVYAYEGIFFDTYLPLLGVLLIVFLIFREIVCWYFKINQTIGLLTDIRNSLQYIQDSGLALKAKQQDDDISNNIDNPIISDQATEQPSSRPEHYPYG